MNKGIDITLARIQFILNQLINILYSFKMKIETKLKDICKREWLIKNSWFLGHRQTKKAIILPFRKIQKGELKCWFQKDKDSIPILFNMNRWDSSKTLWIAEGEYYAMSAIEAGYSNAVSIPKICNNSKSIEQYWD